MRRLLGISVFRASVCIGAGTSASHQAPHVFDATFTHQVHFSSLLFLPASYATSPKTYWPLILYLHGGSLRGDNIEQLRTLGFPLKLESAPDFPFVVVSPQCPAVEIWTDAESMCGLLARVMHDCRIASPRLYLPMHSTSPLCAP